MPLAAGFPYDDIRACTSCPLRQFARQPVPGAGPLPARVMFISQAPGRQEDEHGEPFYPRAQAGKLLDSLLVNVGIGRSDCYITNTVKCRLLNDAAPTSAQMKTCGHWLDLEFGLCRPEIVVLLGAPAIKRVFGSAADTVEHMHGIPREKDNTIYLPTYNPAAALYDTSQLRFIYDDFAVLRGLVSGASYRRYVKYDLYPNPKYTEISTLSELRDLEDEMVSVGWAAADVETVNDALWSIQISMAPGTGYFIGPDMVKALGNTYTFPDPVEVYFHNFLYDYRFIHAKRFVDTMVIAYLLGLPQGLKELASRLCGVKMQSFDDLTRQHGRPKVVDYLTNLLSVSWDPPVPIIETKWDNKAGKVIDKVINPQPVERKVKKLLADMASDATVDPYQRWHQIHPSQLAPVVAKLGSLPEGTIADAPHDAAVLYACRDADVTVRVKDIMLPMVSEMDLDFILHSVDTPILPMVMEMMDTGFGLDLAHLRALSADYTKRMAVMAENLAKQIGHPFNPGSSSQVAKVVYGKPEDGGLGYPVTSKTTTGLISTDDQELKKVEHPLTKGIIEYRRLAKNKDSFADALLERAANHSTNGYEDYRIHTTLRTTRVETGRLSSSGPNLQAMPVRSKEGKQIRKGFKAPPVYYKVDGISKPHPGILMEGDLSQAEVRILADNTGCPTLIDLFLRGDDPHTTTASKIFGISYEDAKQEKYRYPCKRLNFGVIYMISPEGLSTEITEYIADLKMEGAEVNIEAWSPDDCTKLIADWYKLYPEVKDWQMEKTAEARRNGYVTDMFGRARYIPEIYCAIQSVQEAGIRQCCNMPIQAACQGIIKLAMAQLWRERPILGWEDTVKFVMQIHDSLIVAIPDDPVFMQRVAKWMFRAMTTSVQLKVPVDADFKFGPNWGETSKLKLEVAH